MMIWEFLKLNELEVGRFRECLGFRDSREDCQRLGQRKVFFNGTQSIELDFLIVAMAINFLTSGRWYVFGHAWHEESNRMPPGATTILVGVLPA